MNLTPVEQEILQDLLVNGHDLSGNIAENIDRNRTHVSESLGRLEDRGLVANKGRNVYRLTDVGIAAVQNLNQD